MSDVPIETLPMIPDAKGIVTDKSSDYYEYPTQERHRTKELEVTRNPEPKIEQVTFPTGTSNVVAKNAKVTVTGNWLKVLNEVGPMNPDAEPYEVEYAVGTESSYSHAHEVSVNASVMVGFEAGLFGLGASTEVTLETGYAFTSEVANSESKSLARTYTVKPEQGFELWERSADVHCELDLNQYTPMHQDDLADFRDNVLIPTWEALYAGMDPAVRKLQEQVLNVTLEGWLAHFRDRTPLPMGSTGITIPRWVLVCNEHLASMKERYEGKLTLNYKLPFKEVYAVYYELT